MKTHEHYINRCIQLALNGLGSTYPNPMVGSVVVYNDTIIGEGWHRKAGEPHAEVNAINAVQDKSLLKKATVYVSLEPCSHYGKTPPCSDLIIASEIKKVVIGTVDTFAAVSGKGIKKLLEAGCEVRVGVLEEECKSLNKRFFTFHSKKRPYIFLKWAQTEDGFLAPVNRGKREPVWITNKYSKQLVHKWRSEEPGILVGTNTVIQDNPQLTTRLWAGNHPTRVIIDRQLRIPRDSAIFDGSVKTIVICEKGSEGRREDKFPEKILNLHFAEIDFTKEIAAQICEVAYEHTILSLIVEGGKQTLQTFIDAGLWDEARIFTGETEFRDGIEAPRFKGRLLSTKTIQKDKLKIYSND